MFSWHCCFSVFLVGMWAGHDSMMCSMLYGEVWQYSHGLPIFSIVGAPNLALLILMLSFFKLILFFPILGTIAWNFLPFVLPSHFLFCHSSTLCLLILLYISFFPSPVFSFVSLSSPSLASCSAFSLPSIPQCAGIQHICVVISFRCLSVWIFFFLLSLL